MTECYCISLRKAARKMSSIYDRALEPLGINIAQFSLLRKIEKAGQLSLTDLGRLTDLDRSTVGRNTKLLERLGLLQTTAGRDQREARLALTGRGAQLLAEGAPLWDGAQTIVEQSLGRKNVGRLLAILDGFEENQPRDL